MRAKVPSLKNDAAVGDAIKMLVMEPHFLIVTDSNDKKKLFGVISTADLEKLQGRKPEDQIKNLDFIVEEDKVVKLKPDASLEFVSGEMKRTGHKVLPVVNNEGQIEGIVTSSDLLKKVRREVHIEL